MGFQERITKGSLLQESEFNTFNAAPTMGQKIKEGAKDNWGKLLGAGALGAAGATALMTGNDDVNDTINNWHELDNKDQLWNHFMDKGKEGLGALKTGAADNIGNTGNAGGSEASGVGGIFKKSGIIGDAPEAAYPEEAKGGSGVNMDKLNSIAMRYGSKSANGLDYDSSFDIRNGGAYPAHLKSMLFGDADVEVDSLKDTDINKALIDRNNEYQQNLANYNQELVRANQDGYISPEEQEKLRVLKDKVEELKPSLWDNVKGLVYGDDKIAAEKEYERKLTDSIKWAEDNNLNFLLNGNTQDDIAFFDQLKQKFGQIPAQLQPIYQQVMRKAGA